MDEQALLNSMENELKRNLAERLTRNNETIDMNDVVLESAFLIAVNVLISEKQLRSQTNGQMQFLPSESLDLLWKCLQICLKNIFGQFPEEEISNIKKTYNFIMRDSDAKERVNNHYQDLYNSFGENFI